MSTEVLVAIVGGAFGLGGIVIGASLTALQSYFAYRRKRADDLLAMQDRERAIFHGAFAICNFLAERLNQWDQTRNVYALARSGVAQPYLANLIERSPQDSERIMVSLIDLGIRLDAMLYAAGFSTGAGTDEPNEADLIELNAAIEELGRALEIVQLLLDGELPMLSDEDLAEFVARADEVTSE